MCIEARGSGAASPRKRGGRDRVIAVRLRPEEVAAWKEAATLAGRPQVAAWVRDVVGHSIAGTRMPASSESDRLDALAGELSRQGSNLNQAVKALNTLIASGALSESQAQSAAGEVEQAAVAVTHTLRKVWLALDGMAP